MHYDWAPIVKRKPLKWPNGQRLALIITINCEYWDLLKDSTETYYAGGPQTLPDPLPGNVADFPNFTWREYGQRVFVRRPSAVRYARSRRADRDPKGRAFAASAARPRDHCPGVVPDAWPCPA